MRGRYTGDRLKEGRYAPRSSKRSNGHHRTILREEREREKTRSLWGWGENNTANHGAGGRRGAGGRALAKTLDGVSYALNGLSFCELIWMDFCSVLFFSHISPFVAAIRAYVDKITCLLQLTRFQTSHNNSRQISPRAKRQLCSRPPYIAIIRSSIEATFTV